MWNYAAIVVGAGSIDDLGDGFAMHDDEFVALAVGVIDAGAAFDG